MPGVFDPVPPAGPSTSPTVDPEPLTTAADDYYQRLGPLVETDPENGYAVLALADALTSPLGVVHQLVQATDTHEPWALLLDVDNVPEELLPWLAQPAGVRLRPGDTVSQQRARVKAAAGRYAGTDQAMKDEVALTLTSRDPARVMVLHPSRWTMTVVTRTSDTPDSAASQAAALEQVPGGTILTFVVSDDPIVDEAGVARTIDAIGSAGTTIDATMLADWT